MTDSNAALVRWRSRGRHVAALFVFGLAAAAVYAPVWQAGARDVVPAPAVLDPGGARMLRSDVIFQVWLVSRNARTLATAPWRLFDTEHCAPAENTLTLGIPMITQGVLAIPAFLTSGDPLWSWNAALVLLTLLGAFAMYALVLAWTGSAGAGVAAGLLFAFHPMRLATISYPSVWDGTWTVWALLFAERLFARGRWRDAVGLAAATVLQVGASFYPLVAAVLVTLPFLGWLVLRDGLLRAGVARLAFVLGSVALATAWLLGPYLLAESSAGRLQREHFFYATPGLLEPGGMLFPGWSVLVLAGFALAARRGQVLPRLHGDPRWVLLVGAALAAWVAVGDRAGPLPNLHRLLATILPGLDAVRVVLRVFSGTQLVLVLLAGIGAAALIRLGGRAGPAIALVLLLVCGFETLRAPTHGFERSYRWELLEIRPEEEEIAFFDALAERGNQGALLELPVTATPTSRWTSAPRILLSLYHRRRTSTCFGSYAPPGREELAALAERLPEPEAVRALAGLGFTTVVFRHPKGRPAEFLALRRVGRAAEQGGAVEHVYSTRELTAFALRPPDP